MMCYGKRSQTWQRMRSCRSDNYTAIINLKVINISNKLIKYFYVDGSLTMSMKNGVSIGGYISYILNNILLNKHVIYTISKLSWLLPTYGAKIKILSLKIHSWQCITVTLVSPGIYSSIAAACCAKKIQRRGHETGVGMLPSGEALQPRPRMLAIPLEVALAAG